MNPPRKRTGAVTLGIVAREANVHVATAATILNGAKSNTRVSPETRQRVEEVAERLGYRPNRLAQSLRRQRTLTVGLVAGTVENPFFAHMATLCEGFLLRQGYELILAMDAGRYLDDRVLLETLLSRGVDGLIFWNARETEGRHLVERSAERGEDHPVVLCGYASPKVDSVAVDFAEGARLAVRHLLEGGRADIAYLWPSEAEGLATAQMRRTGYEEVLREAGLPSKVLTYEGGVGDMGRAREAAEAIGRAANCPDALFCFNDLIAIGAMMGLRRAGRSIPDDVALVGFDDIPMAAELDVPLTTVDMPIEEVCRSAVGLLLDRLSATSPAAPRQVLTQPRLIVRESSKAKLQAQRDR